MNTIKRHTPILLAAAAVVGLAAWLGPRAATAEQIIDQDCMARVVSVQDVNVSGDAVSGVVVNTSDKPVREVSLGISHQWLWKDEFHPGTDDPGRYDLYTVPGEIPPGGRMSFTYRLSEPLPVRRDGSFVTDVHVVSVVEMAAAAGAHCGM